MEWGVIPSRMKSLNGLPSLTFPYLHHQMVNTEIRLSKRLLLIKENQISQVKKFSTFLCMGGCKKESGLTEIIPFISVSAIRGQHLMFFTS